MNRMDIVPAHIKKVMFSTHIAGGAAAFAGFALLPTLATSPYLCLLLGASVVLIAFISSRVRKNILHEQFPLFPQNGSPEWKTMQQEYSREFNRTEIILLCMAVVAVWLPMFAVLADIIQNLEVAPSSTRITVRVLLATIGGTAFGMLVSSQHLRFINFIVRHQASRS